MNGDQAAAVSPEQFGRTAWLRDTHQFRDIGDRDSELFCCNQKVRPGLLVVRIHLEEHYVLRIVAIQYNLGVEFPEAGLGVAAEEAIEGFIEFENIPIDL